MREPLLLKEALEQTIKKMGLKRGLNENRAVAVWAEAVGKKIASKSRAVKIVKGTLHVKAESPVWSQQLALMAEGIKEKINQKLGDVVVKQIRFRS